MTQAATLLPGRVRESTASHLAELAIFLDLSPAETLRALSSSRAVRETTKPKKRNPSQHRLMVLLPPEQKRLNARLKRLLYRLPIDPAVHGYLPGRSIWSNLAAHFTDDRQGRELAWYGYDLADAFPSVSHRWVSRLLDQYCSHLSRPARALLINLLCYRGRLDQGFPTSPVLFNLALKPLDEELRSYCEPRGIIYTRYADDFTFSAEHEFSAQERRELAMLPVRWPFRFRVTKVQSAPLGAEFAVTHRHVHRFQRRLLRDQERGLSVTESIKNLQSG